MPLLDCFEVVDVCWVLDVSMPASGRSDCRDRVCVRSKEMLVRRCV
jgi:hypothetical protein